MNKFQQFNGVGIKRADLVAVIFAAANLERHRTYKVYSYGRQISDTIYQRLHTLVCEAGRIASKKRFPVSLPIQGR